MELRGLIDLHTHTNQSDGTLSPSELVELAVGRRLDVLAITDHDTVDGYIAAAPSAATHGLPLLCGVEVSTRLPGLERSTHVLGYFFDGPGETFIEWLRYLQQTRRERNLALIERLQAQGIALTMDQVASKAQAQVGRPHFAAALVEHGYASSLRDAFTRYLAETGSAWTERDEPSTAEAVQRITDAGGIAALAHPVRIARDRERLRTVVTSLLPAGLRALECLHPEHTREDTALLLELADALGLAVTGGSDFHGANKPGIQLGTGEGSLSIDRRYYHELEAAARPVNSPAPVPPRG